MFELVGVLMGKVLIFSEKVAFLSWKQIPETSNSVSFAIKFAKKNQRENCKNIEVFELFVLTENTFFSLFLCF